MITDNLPVEVMAEILCRLPIKSILQCTSVCKPWYSLIKNPDFISIHLHKTLTSDNHPRLFLHDLYSIRIDDKNFGEYMSLRSHLPFDAKDRFEIAGSCYGVVFLSRPYFCEGKCEYELILWNPSIRKSLSPPSLGYRTIRRNLFGLGYDCRNLDFKVLRIMTTPEEDGRWISQLYSLNSNSWKNITHTAPNEYDFENKTITPTFVNGALHWVVTARTKPKNSIMVFDVRDEMFRHMSLPECLVNASPFFLSIKVYGESSIAVLYCHDFYECDLWVMKEYGVEASWIKLATVGKRYRGFPEVHGFRNIREVFVRFSRGEACLSSQNLDTLRTKNLLKMERAVIYSLSSYVESLTLLDKGNDVGNSMDKTDSRQAKRTKTCS